MRSYRPEELFDEDGAPIERLRKLAPSGDRRMGANPHANGGLLLKNLRLPDFRDYAVAVPGPGAVLGEATRVMGVYLRGVMKLNRQARNFRVMAPDEIASNRLDALFEVTARTWLAERRPEDDHLATDGRVMEILSEHTCEGWLEGYLLTGRHGLFTCYEAFIHIIDSMFNQHAKWLKVTSKEIPWRRPTFLWARSVFFLSSFSRSSSARGARSAWSRRWRCCCRSRIPLTNCLRPASSFCNAGARVNRSCGRSCSATLSRVEPKVRETSLRPRPAP